MSRKVIVTGGAGYIGSHTVVELLEAGFEPVLMDDFSNSDRSVLNGLKKITGRDLKFYEGRIQTPGHLAKVIAEEGEIDAIIHFAASKAVGESVMNPLKYYENNINSTLAVLEAMKDHGIDKLVFSSSCTVYGQPKDLPVTEETPVQPAESPYGKTKQICEDIISDTAASSQSTRSVSLRYFNPIGAHASGLIGELPIGVPANLIPFITQTAAGLRDKVTVFGDDYSTDDGTCIRDYIHICDLARAHVKAIDYLEGPMDSGYDVFNVGVGEGYSVKEIISRFEHVNDLKLNVEIGPRRDGDVEKIYASTEKVQKQMNWKASETLDDALKSAWNWQKNLK